MSGSALLLPRDLRALLPEFLGLDAKLRQERVFLHRPRRERAVEVIDERDRLLRVGCSLGGLGFVLGARLCA